MGPYVVEFVHKNFPDAKLHGNEYQCNCCSHDDRVASLSIGDDGRGNVLIHCHAGCPTENILLDLGYVVRRGPNRGRADYSVLYAPENHRNYGDDRKRKRVWTV